MVRSLKNIQRIKRKNRGSQGSKKNGESSSVSSAPAEVWKPGVDKLEEGEELQFDPSAYNYLRAFSIGWPCLSFDIVHDLLGLVRTEFPHTVYGVAGTQGEQASWNHIGIFKLSNISGKKREVLPSSSVDNETDMDSDSSSDEDEEDADESAQPILQGDSLVAHFEYHKHPITSIEWSPHEASTLAVSSADNQLTIWDLSLERDEEEEAEFKAKMKEQANAPQDLPPQLLFVHQGQKDLKEIHWHQQIPGMLVSTAADGFNVLMPANIETTIPSAAS